MKTIEIRTKSLSDGKWISGTWQPSGQALATFQTDASPGMLRQMINRLNRPAPSRPGIPDEDQWDCEEAEATLMHYSVPGLLAHRARTPDLEDARALAREVAATTGAHAAILAHAAVDGREVVTLLETVAP